jgi:hypothetical protein
MLLHFYVHHGNTILCKHLSSQKTIAKELSSCPITVEEVATTFTITDPTSSPPCTPNPWEGGREGSREGGNAASGWGNGDLMERVGIV